jgi:hypothetical protein
MDFDSSKKYQLFVLMISRSISRSAENCQLTPDDQLVLIGTKLPKISSCEDRSSAAASMSKFSLFSERIFALILLFSTPLLGVIVTNSQAIAFANRAMAQRITSPGLTQPTATPSPSSPPLPVEESPVEIFVPRPKNPLPGGIKPSTTSPAPANPPSFATNHTNRSLSPGERDKIAAYLKSRNISSNSSVNNLPDPRFILHDTSVIMAPSSLERERRSGRGPLGLGVNAYLPGQNPVVLARPNFYETRRPTTTEFEKASDILDRQDREGLLRTAWQSTTDNARNQALDTALANLNLSPAEIAIEKTSSIEKLSAPSGRVYTSATWAVEAICTRYNNGDRAIAAPTKQDSLGDACDALGEYFKIRNSRIKSSVAVEIIQVGAISEQGNQNTCSASNPNIATLPNPPYSDNQYNSALALYLRAALAAGKFPQATTHFALDVFDPEAHCDPRCFNLTKLYSSIATVMGHARGSTYGIKPSYGTKSGTNNIWWDDNICHGSAP